MDVNPPIAGAWVVALAAFLIGCSEVRHGVREQPTSSSPPSSGHDRQSPPRIAIDAVTETSGSSAKPPDAPVAKPEVASVRTAEEQRDPSLLKSDDGKTLYAKLTDECQRLPDSGRNAIEGLEMRGWVHERFGNPGKAFVLTRSRPLGAKTLALAFSGGEKDKAGFGRALDLSVKPDGKLVLAAYNPFEAPIAISVAFTTGKDHVWHESKPCELKGGWTRIEADLAASDYKTAASDWKHTAAIAGKDEVRGIFIIVNNAKRDGHIFVDGITLDTMPKPAQEGQEKGAEEREPRPIPPRPPRSGETPEDAR